MTLGSFLHNFCSYQQSPKCINCANEVRESVKNEDVNGLTWTRNEIFFYCKLNCLVYLRDKMNYNLSPSRRSLYHINMPQFGFHFLQRVFTFKEIIQTNDYTLSAPLTSELAPNAEGSVSSPRSTPDETLFRSNNVAPG